MSDNNGLPGKPGVPLNPERVGWHWFVRGDFYSLALWHRGHFTFQDTTAWPEEFSQLGMTYAGPVLTPAEVDARVKEARRDALEEAARWHDEEVEYFAKMGREVNPRDVTIGGMHHMESGKHRNCAAAIRALKGEGND